MKWLLANIGINLVALLCVGCAAYLLAHGKEGWGWFLFVGLLCEGTVAFRKD